MAGALVDGRGCLEDFDRGRFRPTREGLLFPAMFGWRALGFRPFEYQVSLLNDFGRRIVVKCGRQVGKSVCIAVKALHFVCFPFRYDVRKDADGVCRPLVLVMSATQKQAKIVLGHVRNFVGVLNREGGFGFPVSRATADTLEFKSGGRVMVVAAGEDGSSARGYSADLIVLDEAAFMPSLVFDAVDPCLAARNGRLILSSTPFGCRGVFYDTFMRAKELGYSVHTAVSADSPLVSQEFLDSMRAKMSDMAFRQEYLGEFVSEADSLFSDALLESRISGCWLEDPGEGEYRLGVDPSRMGEDETAYVIVKVGCVCEVVHYVRQKKTTVDGIIRDVVDLHQKWRFSMVYVDENAVGGGVVDGLRGRVPLRAVKFYGWGRGCKGDMFQNLVGLLEDDQLHLPRSPELLKQLRGVNYELRENGLMHVGHDGYVRDDLACALALACRDLRNRNVCYSVCAI